MSKESEWYKFQEDICKYFKSIGANAETNVTVNGVRTKHDIDVLVKTKFLGEDLVWIIEAKKWKSKVNKLQVLALRTIVDEIGADRGFIISEKGFQKGAIESAQNSNIKLKTFDDLKLTTKELIETEILKTYKKRFDLLEVRYWAHSKSIRIEYGLRDDVLDFTMRFSGFLLLKTMYEAILFAEKNEYPIDLETNLTEKTGELVANNFQQLTNWLNQNFNFLDEKIIKAEERMIENEVFNPDIDFFKAETSTIKYVANLTAANDEKERDIVKQKHLASFKEAINRNKKGDIKEKN